MLSCLILSDPRYSFPHWSIPWRSIIWIIDLPWPWKQHPHYCKIRESLTTMHITILPIISTMAGGCPSFSSSSCYTPPSSSPPCHFVRPYPCNNELTNHCTNITPTLVDQTTYDLPLSPLHPTPYDHVSVIKLDFSSDIDANLLLFRGSTAFEAWVKGTVLSLTCYMIHDVFDQ